MEKKENEMKRIMMCMIVLLMVTDAQARHRTQTRKATPGDPTFDIVISYWEDPDGD